MAYSSYTPSSSSNIRIKSGAAFAGGTRWYYTSVDGDSLVGASSYITDAYQLGMVAGDILEQYNSSANKLTEYLVETVRTSTASAGKNSADLSPGLNVSS